MKYQAHHWIVFLLFTAVVTSLHLWLHNDLVSLVVAPLAIAALLPYTMAESLWLLLILIGTAELFTGLPVGIMTAAIIVPFLHKRLFATTEPAPTFSFFLVVMLIIASQLGLVVLGLLLEASTPVSSALWQRLPLHHLALSLIATSMVVFAAAVVWHEIVLWPPVRSSRRKIVIKRL